MSRVSSKRWSADVRPQRQEPGKGWRDCQPHRAQAWAVVFKGKLVTRRPTKAAAVAALASVIRQHTPLPRSYKLGRQMGKRAARP